MDQWCKVEQQRLGWVSRNQKHIRAEMYKGVVDAVNSDDHADAASTGKLVVLPSSVIGTPRHMSQLFHDSMAIVRSLGKPDLFITMTCNPKWDEITAELPANVKANERPDLIARVFSLKLGQLLDDLRNGVLGKVIGMIYVVEWQKRCA